MGIYQNKIKLINDKNIITVNCAYLPIQVIVLIIANLMLFIPSVICINLSGFRNITIAAVILLIVIYIPLLIIFNLIIMAGNGPQNSIEADKIKRTVRLKNSYPLLGLLIPARKISFDDLSKIYLTRDIIVPYRTMTPVETTDVFIKFKDSGRKSKRIIARANMDHDELYSIMEEINRNINI